MDPVHEEKEIGNTEFLLKFAENIARSITFYHKFTSGKDEGLYLRNELLKALSIHLPH